MKKRNLKTLSINKQKISSLVDEDNIKGGFGFTSLFLCHSNESLCLCSNGCGIPLQTNEGPCPGGTDGCWSHIP